MERIMVVGKKFKNGSLVHAFDMLIYFKFY